jgi:hypothetical protein
MQLYQNKHEVKILNCLIKDPNEIVSFPHIKIYLKNFTFGTNLFSFTPSFLKNFFSHSAYVSGKISFPLCIFIYEEGLAGVAKTISKN